MPFRLIRENVLASVVASAAGDTAVIATLGSSSQVIVVNSTFTYARTATTNQVVGFAESGTTGSHFTTEPAAKKDTTILWLGNGPDGWRLPKNIGLDVTLATAGAIQVDVLYSVLDDVQ